MAYEPMKKNSRMMEAKSNDTYMLQETPLEGNFIKILPRGHFLIHHQPIMQPCQGDTWTHPTTKDCYQLNHFFIKQRQLQLITNIKIKSDWALRNHAAIWIELKFLDKK